jgi:hypothetical protein
MFLLGLVSGNAIRKKCWLEGMKGWDYHVRTNLKEVRCEGVNWIFETEGRDGLQAVVSTAMNVLVP